MIEIEKSDIPGAALVGSTLALIGDLVLYGGDLIAALLLGLVGNIELLAPTIQLFGRFGSESGILAESTADLLIVGGIALLLLWTGYRLLRATFGTVQKRL